MHFHSVFVDLDSLMDTRLALLYYHFPDKIDTILSIYPFRLSDDYPGVVDYATFLDLYKERNKEILLLSVITPIVYLLKDFVEKAIENLTQSIQPAPPKIFLNIYPYQLSEEEVSVIVNALLSSIGKKVDLEVVNMSNKEITPEFLKACVNIYFKYDYYLWLDEVTEINKEWKSKCPEVKFICPSILPIEAKNVKKAFTADGIPVDPFKYFRLGLSSIFDIEFIKLSYYCIIDIDSASDPEAVAPESDESHLEVHTKES